MYVCGINLHSQLHKQSNNRDCDGNPIIDHPFKFHIDPSSISSFSTNAWHTVWITHDGKSYVTGYNDDGRISGSLPKKTLPADTELFLRDQRDRPYKFVSVVCGNFFTLYLVSSESDSTNLQLVFCYSKKTPNPLFVNIGKRTPKALFGGRTTAGVIDTEGGIIILSKSIFSSPTKQVEVSFLPGRDKPVKLVCCDDFIIALGMSGRVYESEKYSINKFKELKELSDSTVVDISGIRDFCFAVLNDGRVFGRGSNWSCKLGFSKAIISVSIFTLIDSLAKYKIVSVYTGSAHSIFKTSESKMIVCGSNESGQLFIPRKKIVFPPIEVPNCKNFTFCVTGCWSSSVFFGMKAPPNFSNNKIIERVVTKVEAKDSTKTKNKKGESTKIEAKTSTKDEISKLQTQNKQYEIRLKKIEQENSNLKKENSNLKDENSNLKDENSNLKNENSNLKDENSDLKKENSNFKKENSRLKNENSKLKSQKKNKFDSLEENATSRDQHDIIKVLIDDKDEESHQVVGKIGEGATSEAIKVIDTRTGRAMCKKILKDVGDDNFRNIRNSMKEIEVLLKIRHPCICEAIGCNMQEKIESSNIDDDDDDFNIESKSRTTIALFFEYLPYNLRKLIDNKQLCSTLKTRIAVEVAFGMSHIHSIGLIHRDLKVENVMLNGVMEAKLIDFGLVHVPGLSNTMTRGVGTLAYMSPEMTREENYDNKTDVYSYGVFLIVLFTGQIPNQKIHEKTANTPMTLPSASKRMSEYCIKLVKRCISPKAEKRPTFNEIIDDLLKNKFALAAEVDYELVFRRFRELNCFKKA